MSSSSLQPHHRRRVVVTGMGAVSPLGNTLKETWDGIRAGKSGLGPITRFDATKFQTRIAGEVKGFQVEKYLNSKDARKMGLFIHYSIAATLEALTEARLPHKFSEPSFPYNPARVGVSIASGMGGLPEIEYWDRELIKKEKKQVTPFFVPMIIPNMASGQLSIILGAKGPNMCIVTACASSSHAIGEAARTIANGYVDMMVAGGAEAVVCELGIVGFGSLKALSTRNDDPVRASRPYDKSRDGFVLSEGAATLILEEYESAKKRGAPILAELVGYGANSDAHHMTSPAEDSEGAAACMLLALDDAKISRSEINYVNTHGTSTPTGDGLELNAVAKVFSDFKSNLNVSSTKSMTGHLLGAAGAIEAAFSVLAIRDQFVPPTINLDEPEDVCVATGLNLTPHKGVNRAVTASLSNSFGFGGTNACLIFKKVNT